ncbi:MAG: MATE family efflux transporter [Clostridia bacterium]|nr:MATE family efflux transporter [Clostridia bacterium]
MGKGRILPLLIKFTLPATAAMAMNSLYNITDRIFVGNAVGKEGLSAITAVFPITTFIMALSVLSGMGCSTLVAIRLGENDEKGAVNVLNHTLVYIVAVAGITSAIGFAFTKQILIMLGVTPDIAEYAAPYAKIIISFSVFTYFAFGLNHTIRSTGKPIIAMLTVLTGGIMNIILDFVLVTKMGLGIVGAAWANGISQGIASVLVILYFIKFSPIKISFKNFKFDIKQIFEIAKIGSAQSFMQFITALISVLLNKTVVTVMTADGLASAGVYTSVVTLLTVPAMGISQGTQSLIGYNYGADNKKRVVSFYYSATVLSVVATIIVVVLAETFAPQLAGVFGKDVALASAWIRRGVFLLPLSAAVIVTSGYFQAKGKQGKALLTALLRQVIFYVPALFVLPKLINNEGIMYAQPVSDLPAFVATAILVIYDIRNYKRG